MKSRSLFAVLLSAAAISACAEVVVGNGRIETESRSVPAFSSVSVGGSGVLNVHKGAQKVEISCDSNILPYVTTTVSNGELRIGFKPLASIMHFSKMRFDVTLPELSGIHQSGSGDTFVDPFKGDSISASLSGSGNLKASFDYGKVTFDASGSGGIDATVIARELDARLSGSGRAELKGAAESLDLVITGSGEFAGREFSAIDSRISVSGSGGVEIEAKKKLDAKLSGSGRLLYWGDPILSQRVSGSGRITRAGD
jgi:hypothetical protein